MTNLFPDLDEEGFGVGGKCECVGCPRKAIGRNDDGRALCDDHLSADKPYGEILDEMDHQAKYQPATMEPRRQQELRIQALGAAISRRDWHATERAYDAIRDKFDADGRACGDEGRV